MHQKDSLELPVKAPLMPKLGVFCKEEKMKRFDIYSIDRVFCDSRRVLCDSWFSNLFDCLCDILIDQDSLCLITNDRVKGMSHGPPHLPSHEINELIKCYKQSTRNLASSSFKKKKIDFLISEMLI